jgi:hypothetical protein
MKEQDYIRDIAEIRSMMERSSKFLSLSGWAGIMAGIYAIIGAFIAYVFLNFNPGRLNHSLADPAYSFMPDIIILGAIILTFSISTAIYFSYKKAKEKGANGWNATSKRLLISMGVPLVTGGILILILISRNLSDLILPFTLLFYGLSLYDAGRYTIDEVKVMGFIQIILGLLSTWLIEYSLLIWVFGFGIVHIIYGIYMHFKYERSEQQ